MFHWQLCVPVRRGRNSQCHESVWKYTELPAPNRAAYIFHDNLSPRPAGPRPGGAPQWTPSRSAAAAAGARDGVCGVDRNPTWSRLFGVDSTRKSGREGLPAGAPE